MGENADRSNALVIVVLLYVGCFLVLLLLSGWKVVRKGPQPVFWRVMAALLWGGLALTIVSRVLGAETLRTVGAAAIFLGLVVGVLRSAIEVAHRVRRLVGRFRGRSTAAKPLSIPDQGIDARNQTDHEKSA